MDKKKVIFVTGNSSKLQIAQSILSEYFDFSSSKFNFFEAQDWEIDEIAQNKAKQAFEHFGCPVITDDTGVHVEGYDNFPGSMAKPLIEKGGAKVIKALFKNNQKFEFIASVAYYDGQNMITAKGIAGGIFDMDSILEKDWKSFYDICRFYNQKEVVSKMRQEEMNKISQGSIALTNLKDELTKFFKKKQIITTKNFKITKSTITPTTKLINI